MNRRTASLGVWWSLTAALVHCGGSAGGLGGADGSDGASPGTEEQPLPPVVDPPIVLRPEAPNEDWKGGPGRASPFSDLQLDGRMQFTVVGSSGVLTIDVTNNGSAAAVGPYGRVRVAGELMDASLYANGAPMTEHTLFPGAKGFIQATYWRPELLQECTRFPVAIDVDHTMQKEPRTGASYSVYSNDTGSVTTQCPLTWVSPITSERLFGVSSDARTNWRTR